MATVATIVIEIDAAMVKALEEAREDRARLLEAADLVIVTRSTFGHGAAVDNLRQVVESVRMKS